jgi:hypothetical protein
LIVSERVVVSERSTRELLAAGRVLAAAHALRAALLTAATSLSHVDALNATRHHLEVFYFYLYQQIHVLFGPENNTTSPCLLWMT